ncbi:MAG TPA: CRISPR-associated endonuclease Cas2 [Thermomicrobiales bacterium]|nr:CRISPR-associated endonuclease Cas2 [Thermomicrobiales bacterium]
MLLVVAYDVADDRRRARLHTLLLGYGDPVQESVFECEVNERQARELKRRARRLVRPSVDLVRYYPLCAACTARIEDRDGPARPAPPVYWV